MSLGVKAGLETEASLSEVDIGHVAFGSYQPKLYSGEVVTRKSVVLPARAFTRCLAMLRCTLRHTHLAHVCGVRVNSCLHNRLTVG